MAKHTQIFQNTIDVHNRLHVLGLKIHQVLSVIEAMTSARANCTENDPKSAPGLQSWIHGTRRLREVALPNGWEREDIDQVPTVVDQGNKIRLAVMNTNSGTGLIDRVPQPTSKKGAATEKAANSNQLELFSAHTVETYRDADPDNGFIHWYLMVYAHEDIVRAEVSCPTSFSDGAFSAFIERIIITIDEDQGVRKPIRKTTPAPDSDSEFDIPVQRKQA